jgi:plastocyanin
MTVHRRNDMPRRNIAATAIAAAVVVVALPACGGGSEPPTCEDPQAVGTVTMADFSYEPGCIEAAPGDSLEVVNEGQAPHTFTVESDGAEDEVDVAAGESATFTVPDLAAGTYRVVCTYHPQMEAALRIGG